MGTDTKIDIYMDAYRHGHRYTDRHRHTRVHPLASLLLLPTIPIMILPTAQPCVLGLLQSLEAVVEILQAGVRRKDLFFHAAGGRIGSQKWIRTIWGSGREKRISKRTTRITTCLVGALYQLRYSLHEVLILSVRDHGAACLNIYM